MRLPIPDGYTRVRHGAASAVVVAPCARAVESILAQDTLYDWARNHAERREYRGRGAAFGVPLPDCNVRVVVRRARHGGSLAPLLGDVFLAPTRAPRELALSLFFQRVGLLTPPVVAYATYALPMPLFRRADVLTQEVPNATDMHAFLLQHVEPPSRRGAWRAVVRLLQQLTQLGVWHPDLNAKNILLLPAPHSDSGGQMDYLAIVLDIDRVRLVVPGDPQLAQANLERLVRSLRKLVTAGERSLQVSEPEIAEFSALAQAPPPLPTPKAQAPAG